MTDKASFETLIDGIRVMVAILTGSTRNGVEQSDDMRSVSTSSGEHLQTEFLLRSF